MGAKGIDMEALSPRDANAQRLPRANELKSKAAAQLKSVKDKEHPPPPPINVIEPSSSDRKEGAVYQVGKLLGKGGFAICYDGKLVGTGKRYALKIVKCQMPTKMEQKVGCRPRYYQAFANQIQVPNGVTNSLQNAPSEHRPVPPRLHLRELHLSCSRAVSEWFSDGHGQAA